MTNGQIVQFMVALVMAAFQCGLAALSFADGKYLPSALELLLAIGCAAWAAAVVSTAIIGQKKRR